MRYHQSMKKNLLGVASAVLGLSVLALLLSSGESKPRDARSIDTVIPAKTHRSSTAASRGQGESAGVEQSAEDGAESDPLIRLTKSLPKQPMPREDQSWFSYEFETWSYICARHRLTQEAADEVRLVLDEKSLPEAQRRRYERFVRDSEDMDDSVARKAVCFVL